MAIPRKYLNTQEALNFSFSFAEAASGVTYTTFEAFATETTDSATITRFVLPSGAGIESTPNKVTGTPQSGNTFTTPVFDVDFDFSIASYARTITGTAFVEATIVVDDGFGTGDDVEGYLEIEVYKVGEDGTTETLLGENETDRFTATGGAKVVRTRTIHIELTEETIAPGEFLRITAKGWARETGAGGGATDANLYLMHDPTNSDETSPTTITAADNHTYLRFHIPFKVEL